VLISDGMAHSDLVSKNISIYPEKVFFSYEAELYIQLCSYNISMKEMSPVRAQNIIINIINYYN